ncbi:MAG: biotin/lipoyl-binding protein [Deferrisomatales bacterium]
MSRYQLVINGTRYDVWLRSLSGTAATVDVNGVTYQVEVPPGAAAVPAAVAAAPAPAAPTATPAAPAPARAAPRAAAQPSPAVSDGSEVLTAPMPGHVLHLRVSTGDRVQPGDTVLVMEAMKMENEIRAHVAGTVTDIAVAAGQDVGVGDTLVVIEAGP